MKQAVVIGVTGGIAAYKIPELITKLRKKNVEVFVIMTHSAAKIVDPRAFEKASGNKVYIDLFEKDFDYKKVLELKSVDHIELAKKANLFIVAPATANVISKVSCGFADDFLTATILATLAPVIFFPSMNVKMWENTITQENVTKLRANGYEVVEPSEGMLACADVGKGRLPDNSFIEEIVLEKLTQIRKLQKKKVIVTSGATIAYIDDVRFITNRSSGKMGLALAQALQQLGADILFVRAKSALPATYGIKEFVFETAEQLGAILKKELPKYDVCFHGAAVSDFGVDKKFVGKITSGKKITLTLNPSKKIINTIKEINPKIQLIGFKAVWEISKESMQKARGVLQKSNADFLIVNDVSKKDQGFDSNMNEVIILSKDGKQKKVSLASKKNIAKYIINDTIINPLHK